jgi:hypothetical protein
VAIAVRLSRFRVLQVGSGIALDYCGKLFADFGADVVKLEPPGGDPMRLFPPVLEGGESGLFAWLNTNKRSVMEAAEALDALLPGADLLLDGRPLTIPRLSRPVTNLCVRRAGITESLSWRVALPTSWRRSMPRRRPGARYPRLAVPDQAKAWMAGLHPP